MKTLTVRQPWASLICCGEKDIENRTWKTDYRGWVLIHAGQKIDKTEHDIDYIPTGAIVGAVQILDIARDCASPWAIPGYYHWVLGTPVLFRDPIPCAGKLSLWEYPISSINQYI